MTLSFKTILMFAALVFIAYAPTFFLAGSIDGDEWVKSGAGALGLALVALLAKLVQNNKNKKNNDYGNDY